MASIRVRQRKDGSEYFAVLFRDRETGKQSSLSSNDRQQAEQIRRVLEANGGDLRAAVTVTSALSHTVPLVVDVVRDHIEDLNDIQPRQRAAYRQQLRDHLSGPIGHRPVDSVGQSDLAQWVREMQDKSLSAKTIQNIHGLLSAAMDTAARGGLRADNPCRHHRLPKVHRADDDMAILTSEQVGAITSHLSGDARLLVLFLVATGMRWSEATALQVRDVDLRAAPVTVRVSRAWVRQGIKEGPPKLGPPKTRRSKRTLAVGDFADHLKIKVEGRGRDSFLFTDEQGRHFTHSVFWKKSWRPAVDAAIADGAIDQTIRIHDLRHTHASWLIAAGADLMTVQHRLGHESIKTTIDRYSHLMPDHHKISAELVNRVIYGLLPAGASQAD